MLVYQRVTHIVIYFDYAKHDDLMRQAIED